MTKKQGAGRALHHGKEKKREDKNRKQRGETAKVKLKQRKMAQKGWNQQKECKCEMKRQRGGEQHK